MASEWKFTAKEIAERPDLFMSGHRACAGCAPATVHRLVLKATRGPTIATNATGCMEVTSTIYPFTAWKIPWIHTAFENAAANASGIEAALKILRKKGRLEYEHVDVIAFGGDGGTFDIGIQALSGAVERGHDFLYVLYDNEAYMNTGIQRSGGTPLGSLHEHRHTKKRRNPAWRMDNHLSSRKKDSWKTSAQETNCRYNGRT